MELVSVFGNMDVTRQGVSVFGNMDIIRQGVS
jgi:hypothetical protein